MGLFGKKKKKNISPQYQRLVAWVESKYGKVDSLNLEEFPHKSLADNVVNVLLSCRENWIPTMCNGEPIDYVYYIIIDYKIKTGDTPPKDESINLKKKSEKKFKKKKFDEALSLINQAINLNAYNKAFYQLRSEIYKIFDETEKAEKDQIIVENFDRKVLLENLTLISYGMVKKSDL